MTHDPDPALTQKGTPRRRRARALRPIPVTPAMLADAPDFAPVPRRRAGRYDGWTHERQRVFVKALAEHGCVRRASASLGMSEVGVYLLRRSPGAEGFAAAWAEAQSVGVQKLADAAMERALHGVPVPIFHKGEQVGERRQYNDRLVMWMLRHHDADRYGGPIGHRVPPHIRSALFEEWERERAARDQQAGAGARERLAARLAEMQARMEETGEPD